MSLPDTTTDIAASHWPMNAWYAAAYDVEVGRRLTPVRVAGVPIVLYRRLDGRPAALADACWHRLVPLALGSLEGDDVRCGYHGIRYDPDGRCTHMPAQQTINPSAAVRVLPRRRAPPIHLGLARRSRARRPRDNPRHALERRPEHGWPTAR